MEDCVDSVTQANNNELLDLPIGRDSFLGIMVPGVESIELEAHLLFTMTTTYYDISKQFMANPIATVDKLAVLQTSLAISQITDDCNMADLRIKIFYFLDL